MSRPTTEHKINGRITNLREQPVEGLVVRAFDSNPNTREAALGEGKTDGDGRYSIRFLADNFGLRPGVLFTFRVDELAGRELEAVLTNIAATVDPVSKTVKIIGQLKHGDGAILSGMSGTAIFPPEVRR